MPVADYQQIYERQKAGDQLWRGYGHSNHGAHLQPWLVNWCASRLLEAQRILVVDLGCGHNEFCGGLRQAGIPAFGIDGACPGADAVADITDRKECRADLNQWLEKHGLVWRRELTVVTAFDTLEHIAEPQLDAVFDLMHSLGRTFCLSIGYGESQMKLDEKQLHETARDEDWWQARIAGAGADLIQLPSGYLIGSWKK